MTGGRTLPALAPEVELADFDTETVALVPGRRRAVLLEGGHAIVLDSCRHQDEVTAVIDEIASASGDEPARVEGWLDDVLQELARLGVVAARGPIDAVPSSEEDGPDRSS